MKKGELQKLNNKLNKEGLESYSSDGYHCILIEYISCNKVVIEFDDKTTKCIKFSRFKNREFVKYSHKSSDYWEEYRNNGTRLVQTELLIKEFLEELSFIHQYSLKTDKFKNNLIYSNVPGVYVYDFVSNKYKIIFEIDGRSHNNIEVQKIDRNRECLAYLYGYKLYRFKNEYIKNYLDDFKREIYSILKEVVL